MFKNKVTFNVILKMKLKY